MIQKKIDGEKISETDFNVALAKYNKEANQASYDEAKKLAKKLRGQERESVKGYAHFFKINQLNMDKALREVMPVTGD